MFKKLLDQMETVPILENDLKLVFSIDTAGHPATLEDFLVQCAPQGVLASFGIQQGQTAVKRQRLKVRSVRSLRREDMKPVVESYLNSIPKDEVLEVVGQGSFTSEQLKREFHRHSVVGERVTEIVRQHNLFLEEAIKLGKVQPRYDEDSVKLPAFDF